MKVRFTDGAAAVTLDEVGRVERGEWVTVSDATGKRLVEQGWDRKGRSSSSKKDSGTSSPSKKPATTPQTKEDTK